MRPTPPTRDLCIKITDSAGNLRRRVDQPYFLRVQPGSEVVAPTMAERMSFPTRSFVSSAVFSYLTRVSNPQPMRIAAIAYLKTPIVSSPSYNLRASQIGASPS